MKIEGSASGSISQRHGSADPDPHQNVMDSQHCFEGTKAFLNGRKPSLFVNFDQFPFSWILIRIHSHTDPDLGQPNPQH
jgi:hypothetical protein